ncbi:MAG TPA: 4Fe-4S binding protein [Candidatus Ruminococcus avistercoris]|nr:4Fe-4S binding protein [Candidatus Ruminococcus avistercoris]
MMKYKTAKIDRTKCIGCGKCAELCHRKAPWLQKDYNSLIS